MRQSPEAVLRFRDVALRPEDVIQTALQRCDQFRPAGVTYLDSETGLSTIVDLKTRQALKLSGDVLDDFSDTIRMFLAARRREIQARLGLTAKPWNGITCSLVAHGDGSFFGTHTDNVVGHERRHLTFAYYCFREPRRFEGGDLVIFSRNDNSIIVEPESGLLVVFDARSPHEVLPVRVPSGRFDDSRFALTGWLLSPQSLRRAVEKWARPMIQPYRKNPVARAGVGIYRRFFR